ncbi:C13 family peptidase [Enhydrobacter sp.]|jgi:hypothetical protein|uniref:C13 family peptidase n=1 Tax=Enhydrobacter sp. TaxID=1894999 RepID=UPI00262E1DD8|nr:C13 family peptidase [Enhydrobacter sp.]WIM13186.1 MAG: hypothetical protein OJF58_004152 [Enhydrobacter sp.]
MSLRAATFVFALSVAACMSSSDGAPSLAPPADRPMAGPATSVPATGWHAMLVGGDDSSPAFDNAVDTLRERLAALGVRTIRTFTADRTGGAGLATSTNVRDGLRNVGGDACFVYITSHGEERGFVLRADRRVFGPSVLDRDLEQSCGSVPTVLVVSACHSGVFISSETRRPNRIILTAAAADRTSFGCGADDDYTYYDQCFLQQIDTARTWRQVATGTKSCVEVLERRLGVRRESRPQAFFGAAVANLHLPGR